MFRNSFFSTTLKFFKRPACTTTTVSIEPINTENEINESLQKTINTLNGDIILLQTKLDEANKNNIGLTEKEKKSIFKTLMYFRKIYQISQKPKVHAASNPCPTQSKSEKRLIVRKLCREILGPIVRNYRNLMFSKMFMNKLRNKWIGDTMNNRGDAVRSTASETNLNKVQVHTHTSQRKTKRYGKNPGVQFERKPENKNFSSIKLQL